MKPLPSACLALCGFAAIVAGAVLSWGIPAGLMIGGVLIVVTAALLYNPKANAVKKAGQPQFATPQPTPFTQPRPFRSVNYGDQ